MQNDSIINLLVDEKYHNYRLDKFISDSVAQISRNKVKSLIEDSKVIIDGKLETSPSFKVKTGSRIKIKEKFTEKTQEIKPKEIKLDVVFEDEFLMVINKQAGLTVHPGAGNSDETLVNALVFYGENLSEVAGSQRPGIVHRLDKDTSGLMVVAKNDHVHALLSEQIVTREFKRFYKALIWGVMELKTGKIVTNVMRSKTDKTKMMNVPFGGKNAVTNYKTLEIFAGGSVSLVECKLDTGRTHQIRLHFMHKKHSVIGDQVYGGHGRKISALTDSQFKQLSDFKRQALHSYKIQFFHPITEEEINVEIDLPDDLKELLRILQ